MKQLLYISMFCLFSFLLAGCFKWDDKKENMERITIFTVSPKFITSTYFVPNRPSNPYSRPDHYETYFSMELFDETTKELFSLGVRLDRGDGIVEELEMIEGFKYEEGYLYRIKVLINKKEHYERLYDDHRETYKLIEILSKVEVAN